jgi:hypothetical protein
MRMTTMMATSTENILYDVNVEDDDIVVKVKKKTTRNEAIDKSILALIYPNDHDHDKWSLLRENDRETWVLHIEMMMIVVVVKMIMTTVPEKVGPKDKMQER